MLHYLLLCLISIFAGLGIIRLIRLPLSPVQAITLAPLLTCSIWSIYFGMGVIAHFTVQQLTMPGWAMTFMLCLIGLMGREYRSLKIQNGMMLFFAILLPMATMFYYFWYDLTHYAGSPAYDGWSYIAIGEYLWHYPMGTNQSLSPLYLYGSLFTDTRFITPALLGFFSFLYGSHIDVQYSVNLFIVWAIFNFSFACLFFANTHTYLNNKWLYLTLIVVSSWMANLLWTNNFDNLLVLFQLPIFAGIITFFGTNKIQWTLVSAIFIAASGYIYPEFFPFIVFCFCVFYLSENRKLKLSASFGMLASIGFLSLLLLLPWLKPMLIFFFDQLHTIPGRGFFPKLIRMENLMWLGDGFWMLNFGREMNLIVGLSVSFITILGLIRLIKEKQYGLLIIVSISLLMVRHMVFNLHYDYGAYKFIIFNWWLITFAFCLGIQSLLDLSFRTKWLENYSMIVVFSIVAIYFYSAIKSISQRSEQTQIYDMAPIRELAKLKYITKNQGILVNVTNNTHHMWAIYYLRNTPIQVNPYRAYLEVTSQSLKKANAVDMNKIHFLLTDNTKSFSSSGHLMWTSGPYRLWKFSDPVTRLALIETQDET